MEGARGIGLTAYRAFSGLSWSDSWALERDLIASSGSEPYFESIPEECPLVPPRLSDKEHRDFEVLFRENYSIILGFFSKRWRNREDAKDLAQETFARAYKGFRSFRRESSAKTWLISIAGNIWKNHLRDSSVAKRSAEEVALDAQPDAGAALLENKGDIAAPRDPLDLFLVHEQTEQVCRLLQALPPQMRQSLHLRALGRSYREIAAILGVEVSTVRTHLHKGRQRIRDEFETSPVEAPTGEEAFADG